jgi:hypothetical protein
VENNVQANVDKMNGSRTDGGEREKSVDQSILGRRPRIEDLSL